MMSGLLSITEAAKELGVTRKTAYRWVKEGRFPVRVFPVGSRLKVSRLQLEKLLAGEEAKAS